MSDPRNVAILIFDEVEVLDFAGPFEVFGVAGRANKQRLFNVYTVAARPGPVLARNRLSINPAHTFEDCPPPRILLIPGGSGTRPLLEDARVIDWIRAAAGRAELALSVCTGALLLAKAGLLDGLSATTYHTAFDELRALAPETTLCPGLRFVDNGRVMTSAGISAGIDMALYVVGKLHGLEEAFAAARYMEYDLNPELLA